MSVLVAPRLPLSRGPISGLVADLIAGKAPHETFGPLPVRLDDVDPYGMDLQLTLCICYELHYRGFVGVDPRWEWDATLLNLRVRLEDYFLEAVRRDLGAIGNCTVTDEMAALSVEPASEWGPSYFLRDHGTWEQVQEYFVNRSLYHLKEGDPHAWAIPRLTGQAKASFVAVEFDEFGAGRGARVHQKLFADLLRAAGLDDGYLSYLNRVTAAALTPVNLMSLFGLRRELRGAAVGHFAATEITSPRGSQRMVAALQRLDAPKACREFYTEHVEADAVHEQLVRTHVVGDLLITEPELEQDVVFGIRAFGLVEDRLANHLMECWLAGSSSLSESSDS